jgi:DNA polymerase-1
VKHGNRLDPINFPPYVAIPPFGRKRRLPDLFSDDNYAVMRAQRQAVNAVIQGFASYVMKIATLQLAAALEDTSARIVAQVHDEMVVEVLDQTEVDDVYRLVIDSMESVFIDGKPVFGSVPLIASGGIGDNWVEAKV